ncbi:hypothetical protein CC2G_003483 [Coprinopsis cinerea AmutBmut pab1-1]|nr:hypothetical protein CC2G_003483 [Coprinopsis cinerea AmutBmut pab1-1]
MAPKAASTTILDALQDFFLVIATIPQWQALDDKIVTRNKLILRDSTRIIYECANKENLRQSKHLGDDLLQWIGKDCRTYDSRPNDIPLAFFESTTYSQPAPILLRHRPSCANLVTDPNTLRKYLTLDTDDATSKRLPKKKEPGNRPPKRYLSDDDESSGLRPDPTSKKSRPGPASVQQAGTNHALQRTAQHNQSQRNPAIVKPKPVKPSQSVQEQAQDAVATDGGDRHNEADDSAEREAELAPATHNPRYPIRAPNRHDLPSTDPARDLADLVQLHISQTASLNELQGHCRVLMDYYSRERNYYRVQNSELREEVDAHKAKIKTLKDNIDQIRAFIGFGPAFKQQSERQSHPPQRPHSVPAVPHRQYPTLDPQQVQSMEPLQPDRLLPGTTPSGPQHNANTFDNSTGFSESMNFQGNQFNNASAYPPFPAAPSSQDKVFNGNSTSIDLLSQTPQPVTLAQASSGTM